jgi:hypothetical protein
MCNEHVLPNLCAFNNCEWNYKGVKCNNPKKILEGEWKTADDNYYRFKEAGETYWMRIQLIARESNDYKAVCSICLSGDSLDYRTTCGHQFHEECIGEWLKSGIKTCPNCRDSIKYER